MDLKKIRCFIEVARLKSFSKAAKILFISQTAVSQQIAVLEKELGVELLYRDKKKVELTSAGEIFWHDAIRLIRQYENIVLRTREIAYGLDGMIKIGFFSMFDRDVISPVLSKFHQQYPKVRLNIAQCSYNDMKLNLLNGTIDIGFSFQVDSDEVEELKVYQTYPKLCVNRSHRLAEKLLVQPEDLEGENVISYIKNRAQMSHYEIYHDEENPKLVADNSFLVENMDDAIMLVSINAGICFLPEVTDFINHEKIIFLNQVVENVPFDVNAYWIKDNQNPVLSIFLDEMKLRYSDGKKNVVRT